MTEKLLQFIWQSGYFNQSSLFTTEGETVRIISRGMLNTNQGPDFCSAMIGIGNTVFAGSVELHIKTSDWEKHEHSNDEKYRNVVLHAVYVHDRDLPLKIPVLELQPHIPAFLLERYERLMNTPDSIPCRSEIHTVNELVRSSWIERMLIERLERRAEHIYDLLKQSKGHWEEVFWWLLARNFGIRVNADAFESVARSLPLRLIVKHKQSIHQVEALLFGQANLLGEDFKEDYPKLLKREYNFLRKKYGLKPAFAAINFLRMRPANFPTVRLAQLAMIFHSSTHLFSTILEEKDISKIRSLFEVTANDYWHYHYTFDELCSYRPKKTGAMIIDNIIINTIVPLLFAHALLHKNEEGKQKALSWLSQISAEDNRVITIFKELGVSIASSSDTQALVEMKEQYCDCKRCLECAIGNSILRGQVNSSLSS